MKKVKFHKITPELLNSNVGEQVAPVKTVVMTISRHQDSVIGIYIDYLMNAAKTMVTQEELAINGNPTDRALYGYRSFFDRYGVAILIGFSTAIVAYEAYKLGLNGWGN